MNLLELASGFATEGMPESVQPLGDGNVNATYVVEVTGGRRYVLQRLNTAVFARPDLVMANLEAVVHHCRQRLGTEPPTGDRDSWQVPSPVPLKAACGELDAPCHLLRHGDGAWRMITFIEGAHCLERLQHSSEAREVGRALGRFHALIHDLPAEQLADTLEGFHVTPGYHARYLGVLAAAATGPSAVAQRLADPQAQACVAFIAARQHLVPVLEQAREAGHLKLRPIHGDPKVNNVMLCSATGRAVAMVDLDTVKPGLLHYDIGDALRSGCNPAGEETTDLEAVCFDLELAAAMLRGYLHEAGAVLTRHDIDHLFDAIRLLPFELGLRFFCDHLEGDVYFKVTHPRHNLERALVQFRLAESIEAQERELRDLISALCES
ncbi:MAG: aminoglycoside phosphotransferase family protein [Synechococcaceae bacterium WB9_2_112]|nr:aminoglycoside phosphotransferase family protein [Synechococcaceae bacterium WB9_2_112]